MESVQQKEINRLRQLCRDTADSAELIVEVLELLDGCDLDIDLIKGKLIKAAKDLPCETPRGLEKYF